jgi:ribonuclease Z
MSDDLKIIFLGTGAAVPSTRRGMPAMAIQKEGNIILCDCGEGTQIKMQQAGLSPSKISAILISHLHGDHLFGLPGFLTSQQLMNRTDPLTLVGPVGIKKFIHHIQTITRANVMYPIHFMELNGNTSMLFELADFQITAQKLEHSILCFGYRFKEKSKTGKFSLQKAEKLNIPPGPLRHQLQQGQTVIVNGRKIQPTDVMGPNRPGRTIVFCTDTRPLKASVNLARDCQVLIHDSTFAAADFELARESHHSTSREAAKVAQEAKAQQLFLWHISMRYNETQEQQLLNEAMEIFPASLLANDFLEIPLLRPAS